MSKAPKALKKITPFSYPTRKTPRIIPQKKYATYSKYKPYLKQEFGGQCVYCRKVDVDQDPSAFHIDHYKPKSLYPDLKSEYINLFYSCAHCNRFKDDHPSLNSFDEIPNPCSHMMSQHFRFSNEAIEGLTVNGQFTEELLRLNDDSSLEFRKEYVSRILLLIEAVLRVKSDKDSESKKLISEAIRQLARMTLVDEKKIEKLLLR